MLAASSSTDLLDQSRDAQTLLPLKLTPPPARAVTLLRPDLQSLLSDVRLQPVSLVIAPAGYGKTTIMSQWMGELTRTGATVCWLSLDSSERDPALFLAYLIRTFQNAFPDVGVDAWRALHSAPNLVRDWPLVAGELCSDLQRKISTATFLFIDDLHLVSDTVVIGQVLGYLMRAAPPTLHIVAATRRAPTFAPLARLRTEGRLVEISQRDLRLSVDEVRQILALQDVTLNPSELQVLLERTEGWALSVQLATRALAGQLPERRGAFVRALGGSQEQLLTYLSTEVLADLPRELIEFLRLAAIPAYFDVELLTEVLQREDVPYLLGRSLALGLPLLPVDDQTNRQQFHPLWRELLLRGVPDILDPDTLAALHRRFGRALENRGDLEAALDHFASAGAGDDLARALRERAWPLLRSPRRDTMRRWLEQVPLAIRERDADMLYMSGVSQVASDPDTAAHEIDRAADLYKKSGQSERKLAALADLAAILMLQARPTELAAVCVRAIRAANLVGDPWSRGAALVCVVAMLAVKERHAAALRVASHATALPLTANWRWLLAMNVGAISVQLGRPLEALAALDGALALPQVDHDDRLRQNLLGLRALALFEQGQLAEATSQALESHRHVTDYYQGGVAGHSALRLALMMMLQGRVDEGMTYVAQARTAFQDLGAFAPLASLQAIEIYGQLQRGQKANSIGAVTSVLRRLRESDTGGQDLRMWLLLALVLGESGEPKRALQLVTELVAKMEPRGYRLFLAIANLYGAYLAGQTGDEALRGQLLRAGWQIVVDDDHRSLPILPEAALTDTTVAAVRQGISIGAMSMALRRQAPPALVEQLIGLLNDPATSVRVTSALLLGDLSAASAYTHLRALTKDRDPQVRTAAEDALTRLVYRPPYALRVRTLGAFAIWRGDVEVRDREWRSSKARQLFQFLLTERGRTVPRERILETLWPEMEPEVAANNLRVTLNRLSKAIEPDRPDGAPPTYVLQQGETYSFNSGADHEVDASDFVSAVSEGQKAEQRGQRQAAITALRRAVQLYGGAYMPDHMYEDWTIIERERLAMLFNDAAIRLGGLLLDEGLAHEAIGMGWRVLEQDQTNEDAYRLLMRAHAYLGERSTALRLYARCVSVLRTELGVDPMPETLALQTSLRDMH